MRKLHLLGVALIVVSAFGAVLAASAVAIETLSAEWLFEGKVIPPLTELEVLIAGEWTLRDLKGGLFAESIAVLCSADFHGSIMPVGEGFMETLFSLSGTEISLVGLMGNSLSCTNVENCPSPKVWALNLDWATRVELVLETVGGVPLEFYGLFISHATGMEPAWEFECTGVSDKCVWVEIAAEISDNEASGDVDALISSEFTQLVGLPLGTCSRGGTQVGHIESDGAILISHVLGGPLAVSSE
jgi:hypothetical protein